MGAAASDYAVNYGVRQTSACPGPITPVYYTIGQVVNIVFADAGKAQWNLYTGGFSLGSTPDFTWANYHSSFASAVCGGTFSSFPSNDNYFCDPAYDSLANAGEFAANLGAANNVFSESTQFGWVNDAISIPIYSLIDQFAGLNCLNLQPQYTASQQPSSLVRTLGHGWEIAYWSLQNLRPNPNFTPTDPKYACNKLPETINRGFSQDTDNLNMFQALTVWDFEVIGQIWDSMLAVNPVTGGANQQIFDWMTQFHTSTFDPNEVNCVGAPTNTVPVCVKGTTTQTWKLRHDIFFHDGTPVTAADVCYSIIATRDVPGALTFSGVANVASCAATSSDTAQVKLLAGAFSEVNIGGVLIIPGHGPHSWVTACGGPLVQSTLTGLGQTVPYTSIPNAPNSNCANPLWDPMTGQVPAPATGTAPLMVGSGPYTCNIPAGFTYTDPLGGVHNAGDVGGPCTETAGNTLGNSVISQGGRALLIADHTYVRGPPDLQGASLQALTWSDKFNQGSVNILDIADAALHFCVTAPCAPGSTGADAYWAHPQYVCPGDTWVDICAIATAAGFFQHGTTSPLTAANALTIDPQMSPTSMPNGPTGTITEQLVHNTGGNVYVAFSNTGPATTLTIRYCTGPSPGCPSGPEGGPSWSVATIAIAGGAPGAPGRTDAPILIGGTTPVPYPPPPPGTCPPGSTPVGQVTLFITGTSTITTENEDCAHVAP
jgi:hypothetical protein